LGRERVEGRVPQRPEVTAALMEEAAVSVRARRGLGHPFIGKRCGKGEHGKLGSGLGLPPGEMNLGGAAAAGTPASGSGSAQAPWRAGRAPTGGG
jgi:hypothetical protein